MPFEDMVKQVALTLERDGSVQAVFGQSIELEHHTIVPVAVVTGGGGGGCMIALVDAAHEDAVLKVLSSMGKKEAFVTEAGA